MFVYFVTFYETEWMDQIAGAEEPDIGLSLPSVCVGGPSTHHSSFPLDLHQVCLFLFVFLYIVHSLLASSMCGLNTCRSFVFVQVISGSFVFTYEIFRWF